VSDTRLLLVRHGHAFAGFQGVIGGPRGCAGLTELGRRQAEALRDHLAATDRVRADVLVSSLIPRAVETAQIIAPGLGIDAFEQDCDLCEVHTGEADGLDWDEWVSRYGSFAMEDEPDREFAPGGDSWTTFHLRVGRVLDRLAREHEGRTVVAVSHGGVIAASMRLLLGAGPAHADGRTSRVQPTNTGVTEWAWEPDHSRWTLHAFNETAHLLGPTPDTEPEPRTTNDPLG
jgi:probable phosphoglycerate mutase